jgi:triosephosphate isomerase
MRQKIVAGNWKMNGTRSTALTLLDDLLPRLAHVHGVKVVVCPPFTALSTVGLLLAGTGVELGAQDVFWKDAGAYTGRVSPKMLTDLACHYVIVGHSEARGRFGVPEPDFSPDVLAHFGDTDAVVTRKACAAITSGLTPIVCVGETLAERQEGRTDTVVRAQTAAALSGFTPNESARVVLAYEPVWAIGTGEVCAADEADRVCGVIRDELTKRFGEETAQTARIQYGGSVKPDNAAELMGKPNIDGALVGGASLKAADFLAIAAGCP